MTLQEKLEEQQEIGKEIGKEIGADEVSAMYGWLLKSGRAEEMHLAFSDVTLRKKLLEEYKTTNSN